MGQRECVFGMGLGTLIEKAANDISDTRCCLEEVVKVNQPVARRVLEADDGMTMCLCLSSSSIPRFASP
jgi:chemotaxis regulatin CheY-phosphate phosphatase CheZ